MRVLRKKKLQEAAPNASPPAWLGLTNLVSHKQIKIILNNIMLPKFEKKYKQIHLKAQKQRPDEKRCGRKKK